ncbi:MAG: 30S ribosomal protein S13 [Bacteroides sp.]|nr:MAG: 30S ribosomal protein S13 [Bacteroides sp.]
MIRISGVELPINKRGIIALTSIYGVGISKAKKILNNLDIDINTKVKNWSNNDVNAIRSYINKILTEGDLRSEVHTNIKRLMDIGCYRGTRHRKGLPVNGQRTKNNSRTRKGKKKTVSNKKTI